MKHPANDNRRQGRHVKHRAGSPGFNLVEIILVFF